MNLLQLPSSVLVCDRYQIERLLGQGGMGRTYLAIDTQNNHNLCVLKEFCPSFSEENALKKAKELFLREAKILQTLSHPQIPKVLGTFEEKGRLFLIQDYIAGQDYEEYLQNRSSGLTEAELKQFLRDILPVIAYIHKKGVIHRDIAPDNIMFSQEDGKPVLIDFGAVKEIFTQMSDKSVISTKITKEGYFAPEQGWGKVSMRSDLYSLGVTAIVLLTGKPPQELQDMESMEWRWEHFTEVSDTLAGILNKMLEYKPSNRYESADAILNALTPTCQPTEICTTPTISPQTTFSLGLTHPLPFLSRGWVYSITVIIMGLLGGSYSYFNFLPYISQLCHLSTYCVSEKTLTEQYYRDNQDGLGAIAGIKLAENNQDLEIIEERLEKTSAKLSVIPSDATISPQVQSSLQMYRQVQQQISDRLAIIEQAQMSLGELDTTKLSYEKLTQETLNSKSVNKMERVKRQWRDLQQKYQKIPDDTLLTSQKQIGIETTQTQIKKLQTRINQRIAEIEAARQEAIRLQKEKERLERQRQQEEALQPQISPNDPQPIAQPKIETPSSHTSTQKSSGWGKPPQRIW
ncbi:MAG: protein kinase [Microcystaceae cyanobacterium]